MKRILLVLCLISGPLFALTPQEENDFITTITSGNLDALRAKLDKGFSPDYQFTLMGFRGHTPLSIAQMKMVPNYEYRNNTVQLKGTKPNAANQAAVYELLASADRKAPVKLTPTAKPAPAQPKAQPKVPVRLVPVTKPVAASPK